MWDTVAWDYRMNRRSPEFSRRGINVTVIGGALQVNHKGETTKILDGDATIGGVRIVVSRRDRIVFFIVGVMKRKKLTAYIAGVSCYNKYVTAQTVQAVVSWTQELVALSTPPPDDPNEDAIDQAINRPPDINRQPNINNRTARWAAETPTEGVVYAVEPNLRLRGLGTISTTPQGLEAIEGQSEERGD